MSNHLREQPLKRAIQQELENPLARRILASEFGPGDVVMVDAGNERLAFARGGGGAVGKVGVAA